jgi:hypothetical protein
LKGFEAGLSKSNGGRLVVWNMFWKMKVPGKVKNIALRLINDELTTKDNKVKRKLEIVSDV